jgi:hypothetical protein
MAKNLSAISLGYAVPGEDFIASVHSVFHSAINLRLHRTDSLLTLTASTEADLPQGIRLDTPQDFSFEMFTVGERVTCRDDILRIDSLIVDLRGAQHWKCDLPALKTDPTNPAVASAWSFVWDILNERQIRMKAEIVAKDLTHGDETRLTGISRRVGEAMRNLVTATRQHNLTDSSAVNALIGLGSGLTPSGDDILVGYMAGLWCTTRDQDERMKFVSNLGKAIIYQSQQTNEISRTYLYHAVQGQVSSRLADLAGAISRGEKSGHIASCTEVAMQVGHTSGTDSVTGLLIGLTA